MSFLFRYFLFNNNVYVWYQTKIIVGHNTFTVWNWFQWKQKRVGIIFIFIHIRNLYSIFIPPDCFVIYYYYYCIIYTVKGLQSFIHIIFFEDIIFVQSLRKKFIIIQYIIKYTLGENGGWYFSRFVEKRWVVNFSCVFFFLFIFLNFYYHNISQPTQQKATRTNYIEEEKKLESS